MTVRLADIRRTLDHGYGIGGGLLALLTEIAQRLDRLAVGVAQDPIDLRSLPLNPHDRTRLAEVLGQGEVDVTLELDGVSRVRETAATGVWWIEHRDPYGDVIAETLEIARIPEILSADFGDIARSAGALRARIRAEQLAATSENAP